MDLCLNRQCDINVSVSLVLWVGEVLLRNQPECVCINNTGSCLALSTGVPQGPLQSPLLF